MNEPQLVADGVKAMRDAVAIPVTVKHRIGIDDETRYGFVRDFVGTVADAGCEVFIVHARNAWLKGLSPKENREIPPLRYEVAHQLKRDFPQLTIVINGGITTDDAVAHHLEHVDGVMVGREAYNRPWWLTEWDARYFGEVPGSLTMEQVEDAMCAYMERACAAREDLYWPAIARHMLGMRQGLPGSRRWRQVLSDFRLKHGPVREAFAQAHEKAPAAA
jgi:tRNA-dihydrouridine synthase A